MAEQFFTTSRFIFLNANKYKALHTELTIDITTNMNAIYVGLTYHPIWKQALKRTGKREGF